MPSYDDSDLSTPLSQVRLLIADTNPDKPVFSDAEIQAFLDMESGVVKLAAATALLTIARDEALTSKVIKDRELTTDGAKLAAELRANAKALRDEVAASAEAEDDGFFALVPFNPVQRYPELTERPWPF